MDNHVKNGEIAITSGKTVSIPIKSEVNSYYWFFVIGNCANKDISIDYDVWMVTDANGAFEYQFSFDRWSLFVCFYLF